MGLPFLLALVMAAAQAAQPSRPPGPPGPRPGASAAPLDEPPVSQDLNPDAVARSSIDRTAMWVGDPVIYTVRVVCAQGIDVLDDDMSGDKLKLDGLEFVNLTTTRTDGPGGSTVRDFHYQVTTYKVEQTTLSIAPMTARYYRVRPGQGIEGGEAAGEVAIPGASIAFRSMLPDAQDVAVLRDGRAAHTRPMLFAVAGPVGAGLLIASIVPALFWTVGLVVRLSRPRKERRSSRQVKREERNLMEEVRALDLSGVDGRRDAYTKISLLVRGHLRDALNVPGPALSGAEIDAALDGKSSRIPVGEIASFLVACDAARYGPPDAMPSADACRAAIDEGARLLTMR
jgi:hypothetical protein